MDIEAQLDKNLLELTSAVEKVDALNNYCVEVIDKHNTENFRVRVNQCSELMKDLNYPKGEAYNKLAKAYQYWGVFDLDSSLNCYQDGLRIFEELKDDIGVMTILTVGTFSLLAKGDYDGAFRNCVRGIKVSEKLEDSSSKGWTNFTMGIMYFDTKDFRNSLKYYQRSLEVFKNINHDFGVARSLSGVGSSYLELKDFENAVEVIQQAMEKFSDLENESGLSRIYNDLGVLYKRKEEFSKSKENLERALEIRIRINNVQAKTTTLLELGELYCLEGDHDKAIELINIALEGAVEKNAKPKILKAHKILYIANKMLGNIEESLDHLEKFTELKESVAGSEIIQQLKMQESNFASEKAEQEAEIERLRNVELKSAHDIISEKNKEITDSINYAKRIQSAILPSMSLYKKHLEDFFVLYKPKDIIAGDFYWLEVVGDTVLFAAADCTGHGVPGAMVSVVCHNSLNRAVREYGLKQPDEILEKTTDFVVEQFEAGQDIAPEMYCAEVKDGMDIALCSLSFNVSHIETIEEEETQNTEQRTAALLQYAGANNPLWILRNNEIIEIKSTKQPVGKFDYRKPFDNHEIELLKGDTVYLCSDGYVDQFGGEKGKKFKAKSLKQLLISISKEPLKIQKQLLDEAFEEWRGDIEQIDDVCIIGVRI